jgi:hypothetical protein
MTTWWDKCLVTRAAQGRVLLHFDVLGQAGTIRLDRDLLRRGRPAALEVLGIWRWMDGWRVLDQRELYQLALVPVTDMRYDR